MSSESSTDSGDFCSGYKPCLFRHIKAIVTLVMVWEFPAVSQSRKEFWGKPQYTKSGMWWFTLVFGFFGLHHFLLRSPQTGLIFLLANVISLGYLWFYDLIQLSSEDKGGVNDDSLDKHGLSWGFGALGLAKGMWIPGNENEAKSSASGSTSASASSASASASSTSNPSILHPHGLISDQEALQLGYKMKIPQTGLYLQPQKVQEEITEAQKKKNLGQDEGQQVLEETQNNNEDPTKPVQTGGANSDGPPNPFFFLAYAILIPIAPLAQLIAGDNYNSISRVLDLTIVPGGFFCYMASIIYDYIILFLFPADLLVFGSKRFFPFTFLGMDPDNHSPNITANVDYAPCPPDNMFISLIKIMIPLAKQIPGVSVMATAVETALATAQVVKTQVIDEGVKKVQQGVKVVGQVGQLASSLPAAAASVGGVASSLVAASPMASAPLLPTSPLSSLAASPSSLAASPAQRAQSPPVRGTMVGGARQIKETSYNSLEYLTLGSLAALVGGGLLVGINRGLQNYTYTGKDDSPPNAGRV